MYIMLIMLINQVRDPAKHLPMHQSLKTDNHPGLGTFKYKLILSNMLPFRHCSKDLYGEHLHLCSMEII